MLTQERLKAVLRSSTTPRGIAVHVERTSVLELCTSEDVVKVRQEVRNRTAAAGFNLVDQTKFVTTASEIARNTMDHGGGGIVRVETITLAGKRGVRLMLRARDRA